MKITVFQGSEKNTDVGFVQEVTFDELAEAFSTCEKGGKHEDYFVRGELSPVQRKDNNLCNVDLLVIDGDCSLDDPNTAPPADDLHRILKRWNVNHIIYTTHSHNPPEKNKWRCLIECPLEDKIQLKATAHQIVEELNDEGYNIAYVKEMGVWSQPWFLPRRANPNDGKFKHYAFTNGGPYQAASERVEESHRTSAPSGESEGVEERIRQIQSGERYHDNLLALSWGDIADGVARGKSIASLRGIMNGVPESIRDERWEQRYNDIERYVDDAISKQKLSKSGNGVDHEYDSDEEYYASPVQLPDVTQEFINDAKIPLPPGLMGQLVHSAYQMQRFQYEEVALVSALGLVSGICGRKFNVSDTGLNIYLTLIMGTGMGKDAISEFIEYALTNLSFDSVGQTPLSFLGAGRFTGPKAVIKSLKNARSQVCVFTEAGLLLGSKAGDQTGLTRALLSLYSCSGNGRITKREVFSNDDDIVEQLSSPALSIVNEATPETLLIAFKRGNSIEVGDLPRQSIFRIHRDKPYPNKKPRKHINEECEERLKHLITLCSDIQADNRPEVIDIDYGDLEDEIWEHSKHWVDIENKYKHSDSIKSNMATRMHLKALKFAGISSVFNNDDGVLHREEWEWAKALVQYEFDGLVNFFAGSGSVINEVEAGIWIVAKQIRKVIANELRDPKTTMDKRYRSAGIVSRYALRQGLKNNAKLNEFETKSFGKIKAGIDVVVDYMIDTGYLINVENDPFGNKRELVKVTEQFNTLWEM
jgi:hypothetical protein